MNYTFSLLLEQLRNEVNNIILNELKNRKPKSLYQPLIYFLETGGKRLRAILLLLCANLKEKDFAKLPFYQAVAIELLHNFTLIHDDIMDNSTKRHNKKTLHLKYDISTAILAGDALLAIAYTFLSKNLNNNRLEIFNDFTEALTTVCDGQALDKEFERRKNVRLDQYYEMISKKTGALIKTCCRIGGLISNLESEVVEKLGFFGEELGIAFQIQDDLLDVVSSESLFGKKIGSDLIEGKKTFLLLKALKTARGKDLEKLRKLVVNKGITSNEVKEYIGIFERNNVIIATESAIQNHFIKANSYLDEIASKYNYDVSLLKQLLDLVIKRKH